MRLDAKCKQRLGGAPRKDQISRDQYFVYQSLQRLKGFIVLASFFQCFPLGGLKVIEVSFFSKMKLDAKSKERLTGGSLK